MTKANDILKIRYVVSPFDIEAMCSHSRYVYELFPDGKVTYGHYEKGNRKAVDTTESTKATAEDYAKLCDELNACIEAADRQEWYVDDCAAEVKIYRPFGRTDTMDRGYGNGDTDVSQIISKYIYGTAGMNW